MLYLQRLKNWQSLEDIKVRNWVIRYQGQRVYNTIWQPLLQAKFGEDYENVSASWLWGRVNARGNSRSKGGNKEELGYLKGGFLPIVDALEASILKNGGHILKSTSVESIVCDGQNPFTLTTRKGSFGFDKVVFCAPIPDFLEIVGIDGSLRSIETLHATSLRDKTLTIRPTLQLPEDYINQLEQIKYRAAMCLILKLNRSLSDIYWLNISDPEVPFGGVIEHTNFIPPSEYQGYHIVYLFKYLTTDHPYYTMSKTELFQTYLPALRRIFPDFKETWVEQSFLMKADYATPVYAFKYSSIKPPFETPTKDLYLANTSQIYPEDRNTSNGIMIGMEVVKRLLS
jgi:protoporphyrinogen oxidase